MGKFMKKVKGMGGVIEVLRQGQLGVRTRARAQAIEKIKELITNNSANGGNGRFGSSTSAKSFTPTQTSYLELRSRRLAKTVRKTVGCAGNKSPAAQKIYPADECRELFDLTNSDMLVDDTSSRLALSAEEGRGPCKQTKFGEGDENREITYHFYGDNELEEDSPLHACVKSFQQRGSRGRAPPSVAQSRSNSRSNSVTRELPPPAHKLRPCGILTRNQRKLEKQFCESVTYANKVADADMEADLFCCAGEHPTSDSPHSNLARNVDVEVSFGEKMSVDEGWFRRERLTEEMSLLKHSREVKNVPSLSARLLPELAVHETEAASFNLASPLDMEIEKFFQEAEHKEQKRFIKQYNFDPVTETPLPGRYDWISL